MTAGGGQEAQHASFDFSLSRDRGTANVWSYGVTSHTFFSRDSNQRFGNLPPVPGDDDTNTQLIDREWGEVPKVFLQYVRSGRWHNRLRWEGDLDWRDVQIKPHLASLPPFADGNLTAWDNSIEERVSRDFTPPGDRSGGGIGELGLQAAGAFRNATRQLSGDFDFSRSQFSAGIDALAGWRSRREILVRYEWLTRRRRDARLSVVPPGRPPNVRGKKAARRPRSASAPNAGISTCRCSCLC